VSFDDAFGMIKEFMMKKMYSKNTRFNKRFLYFN